MYIIDLQTSEPKIDAEATALGWGFEKFKSEEEDCEPTSNLKMVSVSTINHTYCIEKLNQSGVVKSTHICTEAEKEGENIYAVSIIQ